MTFRKALLSSCLVISLACLAGGHWIITPWMGAGALLLEVVTLSLAKRFAAAWLPVTCLVSLVCLAAIGLLAGAPALLMVLGATAGLACWDLMNLDRAMAGSLPSETLRQFERKHARYLALALGLGLLMAGGGGLLSVPIPFGLMIVMVLVYVFSVSRVASYLDNRRARGWREPT